MSDSQAGSDFILERGVRLSRSSLWRFQRQFFDERGVAAWGERIVPTHITSNAFIADAYADVALRFLQDCARAPTGDRMALDPGEPVYIVELGAGTGYFAHLFMSRLAELGARSASPVPRLVYVLTDFTEANLAFWAEHPRIRPLIDCELVDIARLDAETDATIDLRFSGRRLEPGAARNPMLVIANYVFDTISQDVFRIRGGALQDGLATLRCRTPAAASAGGRDDGADGGAAGASGEDGTGASGGDPSGARDRAVLDHLYVDYEYQAIEGAAYGEPALDRVLAEYCEHLGDTVIPFPIGGLRALDRLERIAGGRLLVLTADKGYTELHALTNLDAPHLVHHGSVSMMVNYHAMGRYMAERGGFMLASSERQASLELVALGTMAPGDAPETVAAFDRAMERFGPLDVYELTGAAPPAGTTAGQLLALLRLGRWDPYTFMALAPRLGEAIPDASDDARARIRHALEQVWELYFPLPGGHDVPFELGFLYYKMSRYPEAFHFYEESLRHHGPHAVTYHNMGLCQYQLGQLGRALALFERSLERRPDYGAARGWRLRLLAELEREPLLVQEVGGEGGDAADTPAPQGSRISGSSGSAR